MTIHQYFEKVKNINWFSNVGGGLLKPYCGLKIRRVDSWDQAVKWAQHELTIWCLIESGNVLMSGVRSNSFEHFSKWNSIARNNLNYVMPIIEGCDFQRIPKSYQEIVFRHLQSQLVGAFMELAYDDCAPVVLLRQQIELYQEGLFPCGWRVDSPDDFPRNAEIIVY